jgi:UDP-glucuronate 4-epimerase
VRILITGVAGFIGYHVARRLLKDGHSVTGFDNLSDYYDVALKQARLKQLETDFGFESQIVDVADESAVRRVFAEASAEIVIHLAAQAGVRYSLTHPEAYARSNLLGFTHILEACRSLPLRHLLYASSSSVYGANAKVPFSEHDGADHPVSLYAATKRANELMAHSYAQLYGIPATGLRFFTVYGPWGRPDMAYFKFTKAILEGKPIDVYAEGEMSRDFTYVDDISEAIVRLAALPPGPDATSSVHGPATAAAPWRIYNIGNHTPVRLDRFIAVIEAACGKAAIKRHLPMQPGDVRATYADVSDLMARVDFRPDTSIETGIARFVAWYREFSGSPAVSP